MATSKLYIGRKVRELREKNRATQAAFAERLGISTSYLNQIENNQRPVSATVLLSLAQNYQVDISEISRGDDDRLLSALSEVLKDPVFASYGPGLQELKLVVQNAPGMARALIDCHQAFRRNSEQLASLDDRLGATTGSVDPTPYEEVRDFFHFTDNYIHDLDIAVEEIADELGIPGGNPGPALQGYLDNKFSVRISLSDIDNNNLRRYDPASRTLFLNPYSPASTRSFQMAFQIAGLAKSQEIDVIAENAGFRTRDATEICKIGLQNYCAGAMLLPYKAFHETAKSLRHDLELLASRFDASLEQIAHRLSTLQRPNLKGTPVFFARVDQAGNITKRHSAAKLQFARYGAACPLWNVHQAFERPGRIIRQLAETPDGVRYLCIATEISKTSAGFSAPHRRYAIALGCEISYASEFVYADGLDLGDQERFEPIGISCRICERENCYQRAVPPLKSKLHVDPNIREILPYRIS